jgi:hypothetical protein
MLKAEQIPPDAMYAAWKAMNAGMTLNDTIAAAINAWPGVETIGKANRATPAATLEQQILDPNHPKNDREWWAADEITRLTAENEKLRDVLSGVLWMADEWFNHGGDETAFSDDHAAKLEAARAAITQETRDD